MMRITIECGNVKGERIAKHLDRLTDEFRLWTYDGKVYASFEVESFSKLKEIRRRLKRIKDIELKFVKISKAVCYE